eukprot:9496306-Pyramimonas_sp.AAC.4
MSATMQPSAAASKISSGSGIFTQRKPITSIEGPPGATNMTPSQGPTNKVRITRLSIKVFLQTGHITNGELVFLLCQGRG